MSADTGKLQAAVIRELCKPLRLPTIAAQAVQLAEQAAKEKQSPLSFLEALLSAEIEEREQNAVGRRIKEAHFPKVKSLEEFNFQEAPHLPVTLIRHLADFLLELGDDFAYIGRQRRLRLDDTWFRVDLLFFHRRLRSLLVIDLKAGKFSHTDVERGARSQRRLFENQGDGFSSEIRTKLTMFLELERAIKQTVDALGR